MVSLSVIVPTRHRNDLLAQCLDRLSPGRQTLAASNYEVIVTDDGSLTSAREMVADKYPWAGCVQGPRRGPAANRNYGARHASGEWVVFLDDDCLPDARWLEAILSASKEFGVDVIEGKTVCPGMRDHPLVECVRNEGGGAYWSCNMAVRRSVFMRLGGFDEDFSQAAMEDMEFAWRFQKAGHRAVFVPAALVEHPPRRIGLRKYWWRTVSNHRWHLLFLHKTGGATPCDASLVAALLGTTTSTIMNLLRNTWHLLWRFDANYWRTPLVNQVWQWIVFPWLLCCKWVWEIQIRRDWDAKYSHKTRELTEI